MPPPTSKDQGEKQQAAQQAVDILHEISTILLSICISMIENGVNPEALAQVVQYLRKEAQKQNFRLRDQEQDA
ncbi:hypothetical protein G7054_g3334 [Neopestalotiopsis clavispora]|nr:hypothetical protein G7054_g3334 [Neopestalotiopsis clavispora]